MTQNPTLPEATAPTLALVHPTAEEKVHQFKLNGAEWRGALTPEAYLRREDVLSQQELTRDGGITWWILVDTAAKENPLDPSSSIRLPLASCDTLRKSALVWQDGKVAESVMHGIGSVFCAKELRGRGYGARLMQELGRALKTWQADDTPCVCSVLYSDIGKEFYAKQGWAAIESACVSIPTKTSNQIIESDLPIAQPLFAEDLEALCEIDKGLIRKRLEARPANSKTAFAEIPDVKTIRWHHAREEFVSQHLRGKVPEVKGAIVGEKSHRIWVYFSRVWYNDNPQDTKGNTLYILRLASEDDAHSGSEASGKYEAAIASLLLMAQREAQEWGLGEVEVWNPSAATLSAARILHPSAAVVTREKESIASLNWYGSYEGSVADSIEWVEREKYVWC